MSGGIRRSRYVVGLDRHERMERSAVGTLQALLTSIPRSVARHCESKKPMSNILISTTILTSGRAVNTAHTGEQGLQALRSVPLRDAMLSDSREARVELIARLARSCPAGGSQ